MSLADEVLAEHKRESSEDFIQDEWCGTCNANWPCKSVRLATSLQVAELLLAQATPQVRHSMRNLGVDPDDWYGRGERWLAALDEYDKGGRQ